MIFGKGNMIIPAQGGGYFTTADFITFTVSTEKGAEKKQISK